MKSEVVEFLAFMITLWLIGLVVTAGFNVEKYTQLQLCIHKDSCSYFIERMIDE